MCKGRCEIMQLGTSTLSLFVTSHLAQTMRSQPSTTSLPLPMSPLEFSSWTRYSLAYQRDTVSSSKRSGRCFLCFYVSITYPLEQYDQSEFDDPLGAYWLQLLSCKAKTVWGGGGFHCFFFIMYDKDTASLRFCKYITVHISVNFLYLWKQAKWTFSLIKKVEYHSIYHIMLIHFIWGSSSEFTSIKNKQKHVRQKTKV